MLAGVLSNFVNRDNSRVGKVSSGFCFAVESLDFLLAGKLPGNYALTFSRHEKHHGATIRSYLRRGGNVAQVFDVDYYPAVGRVGDLPATVRVHGQEFAVVDGDKHDVRLPTVDGRGVIIGLRLKGTNAAKSRARQNGFATGGDQ